MSDARVCSCVRTRHIVISVRIGMNYAIFVMRQNTNDTSVCYVTSENFATRIYSATELLKATNMIV